jgi:asparagine synthase (glutamine-hydrolysing)
VLEYLILLPKVASAAPSPPQGAGWRRLRQGECATIWVRATGLAPWPGYPVSDGYLIGLTDRPARTAAEVRASWGAYVLVRHADRAIAVSRDPSGRVPAYWTDLGDTVAIASHMRLLRERMPADPEPDWRYLTLVAAGHYLPARHTGLREVHELLPGEELALSAGTVRTTLWWRPETFYKAPRRGRDDVVADFRTRAVACVESWARRYDAITVDLSGGLDSSIMLGLLATSAARPSITCLNVRVGHAESDERIFAQAAAGRHRVRLFERMLDGASVVLGAAPSELQPRPTTRLLGLGIEAVGLDVAHSAGAQAYFTGRGGDHIFLGHTPTLAARDYLRATRDLPGWIGHAYGAARRQGQPLLKVLGEGLGRVDLAHRVEEMSRPASRFVRRDAIEAIPCADYLHPWLAAAVGQAPAGKFAHLAYLVELQRHHDRIGRAAEIDEVHPFMSQPMLELSLATPSDQFAAGPLDRALEREAFQDLIPQAVLDRRYKSSTTSNSLRFYRRNLPQIRAMLLEGGLAAQGLLETAALEAALTPAGLLDGRFSADLQSCLITELWIDGLRRAPAARRSGPEAPSPAVGLSGG